MAKPVAKKTTRRKIKIKRTISRVPHGQDDIRKPFMKPKLLRPTPRWSIGDLFKKVDQKKREASKEIAIKKLITMNLPVTTKIIDPKTLTYRVQTYSKHNRHIHNVSIFKTSEGPLNLDSHVIVDCSCASHVYQAEWHLAKRGNAFMFRCNGETPLVNTKPTICKHVYQALRYMIRMSKNDALPKKTRVTKKFSFTRGT